LVPNSSKKTQKTKANCEVWQVSWTFADQQQIAHWGKLGMIVVGIHLRHAEGHTESAECCSNVAPDDGNRATVRVHEPIVPGDES
jgi:hypothetical protein